MAISKERAARFARSLMFKRWGASTPKPQQTQPQPPEEKISAIELKSWEKSLKATLPQACSAPGLPHTLTCEIYRTKSNELKVQLTFEKPDTSKELRRTAPILSESKKKWAKKFLNDVMNPLGIMVDTTSVADFHFYATVKAYLAKTPGISKGIQGKNPRNEHIVKEDLADGEDDLD